MGKGKGIFGIMVFIFITLITIPLIFELTRIGKLDFVAGISLLIISLLTWSTAFLIPSVFCIIERKVKNAYKYLYSIIPVSLFWFLIYTFAIAMIFGVNFISGYITFLGMGLGLSLLGGLIVAGAAALYPYVTI